jgi:hypothetical protein
MPQPGNPTREEKQRLEEARLGRQPWRRWGPYLSERQWGTVREDYSPGGDAWTYLPHDHARSRAYRWGEDGLAGISDDEQRLCLALALWNGRDPILKERLFGLTNNEGNHGEDVKEIYYYLDATPTHSYLKMLYKYPQREFPYARLMEENRRRARNDLEFELLDGGFLELALHNPVYQDIATKFFEHFLHIAEAMTHIGGEDEGVGLWDDRDQFYYDQLNLPDGHRIELKVRSIVGLIPLFAVEGLRALRGCP